MAYRLPGDKTPGGRTFQVPPAAVTAADVSRARDREDEAAAAAARGSGVVFGVVGDTGQTEVTRGVLKHLSEMKPHALLHTGDLSYADGFPPRWDTFGRLAEPLMSKVPMLVVAGNHDVTLNGVESTAFRARYPTPYLASGSASPGLVLARRRDRARDRAEQLRAGDARAVRRVERADVRVAEG